jgi:GntR family transcriptional regulator
VRGPQGNLATVASMPIDLNRPDVPKHVQLADWIRARIDDGTYAPQSRIPSEATYVQETGIARDTVRKAIQLLIEEDRLYIVRGLGTFVKEK